ncbi:MAG TPA: hypothetical protein VKR56_08500 [Candidatus Cybelea sp.]|nr:hypothetical protein [Candidatus Cybelea sp.]
MTSLRVLQTIATLVVAGIVAGCAGAGSAPPTAGSSLLQPGSAIFDMKCNKDHGVYLSPCAVTLTISNPDATVTANGPVGGTFSFTDKKCSKKSIATVEGAGSTYDVAAGTTKGNCTAMFTDKDSKGKTIGVAVLKITNKV